MQLPIQIAFRNMPHSETIEELVRDKAAALDRFADHIMGCRVVVEVPHRHHQRGNLYQVKLDITVPGEEIVVSREPTDHLADRDLQVALRDAFDTARRQLEDYVRRRRGFVKTAEALPHARISKLVPEESYGFLSTSDGREIYFHSHSVLEDGYKHLQVGTEVAFAEEEGHKGPQATTVKLVGRHHHVR